MLPSNSDEQPPSPSLTLSPSNLHLSEMQQLQVMEWQLNNGMSQSYSSELPISADPVVDQGMASTLVTPGQYYRAPTRRSGSRHFQRNGRFRQAEAPLPRYQKIHGSIRTVAEDWSFGIDSGRAWIGTDENPGTGTVWRTPSKNPLIVDRNLTQQIRYSPYRRNHRPRMTRDVEVNPSADTRDGVDPSVYMIHTNSTSISLSNLYLNHFINNSCRRGNGNNNTISLDRSCRGYYRRTYVHLLIV